jgi:hypothetical protein
LWQDENFDRAIRNEEEFLQKINYIINNPIKANLANEYESYKWLYVKGWIHEDSQDRRDACPTNRGEES